jgi:uncharacterized protein (DUF1800 family)
MSFPAQPVDPKLSADEAARFLVQASFGGRPEDIVHLQDIGIEAWLRQQFAMPIRYDTAERLASHVAAGGRDQLQATQAIFWENALRGEDQLRWRAVNALSQILVVSGSHNKLSGRPDLMAIYLDRVQDHALGNYCDLVRDVTMDPSMSVWLSFNGNRKADPERGNAPDENYARELLQLFTIGLDELTLEGEPTGEPAYTNEDIEGLARVFTGFSASPENFGRLPNGGSTEGTVGAFNEWHEAGQKRFLGRTVDFGANAVASRDAALDIILSHPNVAPFIGKQLIQKFVRSNPTGGYVRRVSEAFNSGIFTLSDGTVIGEGRRCDMQATLAAVLLDPEARDAAIAAQDDYGKVRSTILRAAHLLRVLGYQAPVTTSGPVPDAYGMTYDLGGWFNQPPLNAESVFNHYRRTFVPSGTEMADRGLVAPEMEIFSTEHILGSSEFGAKSMVASDAAMDLNEFHAPRFVELTRDEDIFLQLMETVFAYGSLEAESRQIFREMFLSVGAGKDPQDLSEFERNKRLNIAVQFLMTTPEFTVQR